MHRVAVSCVRSRCLRVSLVVPSLLLALPSFGSGLLGDWSINIDPREMPDGYKETRQVGTRWNNVVWVGGLPVPLPTGRSSVGNPNLREPLITKCEEFSLSREADVIRLDCGEAGTYNYRLGEYRGRTVKLSERKLTEKYKSTNRSVYTEYLLDKHGILNVRVALRMGKVKSEYRRIFGPSSAGAAEGQESPGISDQAASTAPNDVGTAPSESN